MRVVNMQRAVKLLAIGIFSVLISCSNSNEQLLVPGISKELAALRAKSLSEVSYQLKFSIPENKEEAITGDLQLDFTYQKTGKPLIIDFNSNPDDIKSVRVNNELITAEIRDEHLVIPEANLEERNSILVSFIAGNQSLNRKEDYLYTLFVPERASTCFPVFDQPDIKAKYALTLEIPESWESIANGKIVSSTVKNNRKTVVFEESKPISSYLFAFTAGNFQRITRTKDGRQVSFLHRETDSVKVARNIDAIVDWHLKSLDWLEVYTQIDYPFSKMEFALIPSFQYGGMEHPGSIFYKAESLFLDESATLNQELGRARLIAHEVSHMWFGNLVTMQWFDDVWLKEVFANFMAAKIVNPSYPEINHDLKFLMSHYPSAYAVDRTQGTHPIKQELENLKNAGSLYGSIIYQKAPIVMRMLEEQVGEESFKKSMREYLSTYSFGNATWQQLFEIVNKNTEENLTNWNERWVMSAGMPTIIYILNAKDSVIRKFSTFNASPDGQRGILWPQSLKLLLGNTDTTAMINYEVTGRVDTIQGMPEPTYLFTNAGGMGYGYFIMGKNSKSYFLENMNAYDPLLRGALWINFNEAMLREQIDPKDLMSSLVMHLPNESNSLLADYMLSVIERIYWKIYTQQDREAIAPKLEGLLLNMAIASEDQKIKSTYFDALKSIAITDNGINLLINIWSQDMKVEGLTLSENDYISLAQELTLKTGADSIINQQLALITNPDRKKRVEFIKDALSGNPATRDTFFKKLSKVENRENEPWVLEGIRYLHHPMYANESVKYIKPSLEMLEEIKITGDIFFPKRWLDNTFWGHSSADAVEEIRQFLYQNNKYPKDLKMKLLQASDELFRIVEIKESIKEKSEETIEIN